MNVVSPGLTKVEFQGNLKNSVRISLDLQVNQWILDVEFKRGPEELQRSNSRSEIHRRHVNIIF